MILVLSQDIYELRHQDGSCVARQVNHYDTGSSAIMNCSVMQEDPRSFCVATSQDDLCQLYNLRFKVVAHKEGQEDGEKLYLYQSRSSDSCS